MSRLHAPLSVPGSTPLPRRLAALLCAALGATLGPLAAAQEPAPGGTIQYGHFQEPSCLVASWVQGWYLQRQFSDNLVSRGADGKLWPWLATSWSVSKDRKSYTFQLKPNVRFTDGTPLDAPAVAANFKRWLDVDPAKRNNAAFQYFGDKFESATATGPLTVRVTLKTPYQPFLTVLSHATHGILSPASFERSTAENCERPVGSGPFVVEKWNRGLNVVFKRNPNYNSAPANARHQGPAYVEGLVWKFLKEPTVRYGSLLAGESDVIYDIPAVHWKEANEKFTVVRHITGGSPLRLQLNTAHPPFDDLRVRRALAHAADRQRAVEVASQGAVPFEGNGALSQSAPEYLRELASRYPFDPAQANRLLDEAGWTGRTPEGIRTRNGVPLTARVAYGAGGIVTPDIAQALQIVQEQARAVGFNLVFKPTALADWWAGKNRGPNDYDILPAYWTASGAEVLQISWRPDAGDKPNPNNASRFQDPKLWALIREADQTADDARRVQLYQQAQRLMVDSAAVVGLATLPVALASSPRLKGVWLAGGVGEPVFHDAHFVK